MKSNGVFLHFKWIGCSYTSSAWTSASTSSCFSHLTVVTSLTPLVKLWLIFPYLSLL